MMIIYIKFIIIISECQEGVCCNQSKIQTISTPKRSASAQFRTYSPLLIRKTAPCCICRPTTTTQNWPSILQKPTTNSSNNILISSPTPLRRSGWAPKTTRVSHAYIMLCSDLTMTLLFSCRSREPIFTKLIIRVLRYCILRLRETLPC